METNKKLEGSGLKLFRVRVRAGLRLGLGLGVQYGAASVRKEKGK